MAIRRFVIIEFNLSGHNSVAPVGTLNVYKFNQQMEKEAASQSALETGCTLFPGRLEVCRC